MNPKDEWIPKCKGVNKDKVFGQRAGLHSTPHEWRVRPFVSYYRCWHKKGVGFTSGGIDSCQKLLTCDWGMEAVACHSYAVRKPFWMWTSYCSLWWRKRTLKTQDTRYPQPGPEKTIIPLYVDGVSSHVINPTIVDRSAHTCIGIVPLHTVEKVAGRLQYCKSNWRLVTKDRWI